jgi:hypothetical protein
MEKLPQEKKELLQKRLPDEAVSQHPTKKYLSTIKAIYVVERFNEVFGVGGWSIKYEVITTKDGDDETPKQVVVRGVFTVRDYDMLPIEQFGGNDNKDLGDAYKGACTDALTKIGSYLGVGMDVFKGLVIVGKVKKELDTDKPPFGKGSEEEDDFSL